MSTGIDWTRPTREEVEDAVRGIIETFDTDTAVKHISDVIEQLLPPASREE